MKIAVRADLRSKMAIAHATWQQGTGNKGNRALV